MTALPPHATGHEPVLFDLAEMLRAGSGLADPRAIPTPHAPEFYGGPEFEALVESIAEQGVVNPVTISALGNGADGHRRILAAIRLGLRSIPFVVNRAIDSTEKEVAAQFSSETSSARNPRDHANTLARFMGLRGFNNKQAALALGLCEATISNYLKVLKFPPEVQEAVGDGRLTRQHLIAVSKLPQERQDELLLGAASKDPVPSAASIRKAANPKRAKKPDPKFKRLNFGEMCLHFPAAMTVADLIAALEDALAHAQAQVKATPKGRLSAAEVFLDS